MTKFPKLLETYNLLFGDDELCPRDRRFERRKVMQAVVYILQQKGVAFGYDDFCLKVVGIHSVKLSHDLDGVIRYEKQ